jgi:hypothetical protein
MSPLTSEAIKEINLPARSATFYDGSHIEIIGMRDIDGEPTQEECMAELVELKFADGTFGWCFLSSYPKAKVH